MVPTSRHSLLPRPAVTWGKCSPLPTGTQQCSTPRLSNTPAWAAGPWWSFAVLFFFFYLPDPTLTGKQHGICPLALILFRTSTPSVYAACQHSHSYKDSNRIAQNRMDFGVMWSWMQITVLFLTRCLTLGKGLNSSLVQMPYSWNGECTSYLSCWKKLFIYLFS